MIKRNILFFLIINTSVFASENPIKFIPLEPGVEKYVDRFESKMDVTDFNKSEEIFDSNMDRFSKIAGLEFGISEIYLQKQFMFDVLFMNDDSLTRKYSQFDKAKILKFKSEAKKAFL